MNEPAAAGISVSDPSLMLFALGASRPFGERVGQMMGIELSPHEEREFEDGEHKARPLVSVRGQDVYVLHSLYADTEQSGNDKFCRLLFFVGALKDAGAARITAIVPYLAYARKDRKTQPRDPVTTRYVAMLFEAVGIDTILTMDVHNLAAYQNAFRCCTEHVDAHQLLASYFAPILKGKEVVVVAPDAGAIKRAEVFRQLLGQELGTRVGTAFAEKYRSGGVLSGSMLVGDIKGKEAILIDDLISSGATMVRTAQACIAAGASRVYAAASHGLFADEAINVLEQSSLERIVVTDTVLPRGLVGASPATKVMVLSCASVFAHAIKRLHSGPSAAIPEP